MVKNWKWITEGGKVGDLEWTGSAEIQRRHQHWAETIGGAGDIKMKKMNARETMAYLWIIACSLVRFGFFEDTLEGSI